MEEMVLTANERWKVEQGYQRLKEELGLDHFEGRSWRGLHHHITLCFLAYTFLLRIRKRLKKTVTFPQLRQWIDQLLCAHRCPRCEIWLGQKHRPFFTDMRKGIGAYNLTENPN